MQKTKAARNVPSGRWKKGPEGSKGEHYGVSLVPMDLAADEGCRTTGSDEESTALHAKVCNQPRWIGLEKASTWEEGCRALRRHVGSTSTNSQSLCIRP